MKNLTLRLTVFVISIFVGAAACDALEDPEFEGKPLFTIAGDIGFMEEGIDLNRLRAAITWDLVYYEEVELEKIFPNRLAIHFHKPPQPPKGTSSTWFLGRWWGPRPEDWDCKEDDETEYCALVREYSEVRFGRARIVIYEDMNGNGKLDKFFNGEGNFNEPIDRIVYSPTLWHEGFSRVHAPGSAQDWEPEVLFNKNYADYELWVEYTESDRDVTIPTHKVYDPETPDIDIAVPEQVLTPGFGFYSSAFIASQSKIDPQNLTIDLRINHCNQQWMCETVQSITFCANNPSWWNEKSPVRTGTLQDIPNNAQPHSCQPFDNLEGGKTRFLYVESESGYCETFEQSFVEVMVDNSELDQLPAGWVCEESLKQE